MPKLNIPLLAIPRSGLIKIIQESLKYPYPKTKNNKKKINKACIISETEMAFRQT